MTAPLAALVLFALATFTLVWLDDLERVCRRSVARVRFDVTRFQNQFCVLMKNRPWWLRWTGEWAVLIEPVIPRPSTIGPRIEKRRRKAATRRLIAELQADLGHNTLYNPCSMVDPGLYLEFVIIKNCHELEDARPSLEYFLRYGWVVNDDPSDMPTGRQWCLKRVGWPSIYLTARLGSNPICEVVEYKETRTEKKYKILCPGEKELTGLTPAEEVT